jgi:hypothetical protein
MTQRTSPDLENRYAEVSESGAPRKPQKATQNEVLDMTIEESQRTTQFVQKLLRVLVQEGPMTLRQFSGGSSALGRSTTMWRIMTASDKS